MEVVYANHGWVKLCIELIYVRNLCIYFELKELVVVFCEIENYRQKSLMIFNFIIRFSFFSLFFVTLRENGTLKRRKKRESNVI